MTRRKQKATIRPLPETDPRNMDHPSQKERLLELARAIGRMEAREEFRKSRKLDEPESDD
jgi:hypothetical protein